MVIPSGHEVEPEGGDVVRLTAMGVGAFQNIIKLSAHHVRTAEGEEEEEEEEEEEAELRAAVAYRRCRRCRCRCRCPRRRR